MSSTIKDIARRCGVSEGTVDRALNNRPGISDKTKEAVMKVAKELDYKPNHMARCLAMGSTKTIGVVATSISSEFQSALVEEIEHQATDYGYFISLILSRDDLNKELEGIKYMAERKVDGLIIFPIGHGLEYENELKKLNVPIVTIYNRISCDFTHVDVDCRLIMREAVKRISEKGYRRIIYMDLGINRLKEKGINIFSLDQRRMGYSEGLALTGTEGIVFERYEKEKLIDLLNEYKVSREQRRKTAVLCPCDIIAIKVLNLCRCNEIAVPEDVGIMGFDNIDMIDNISPRINTVDCGARNLGSTAFSILMKKIKNEYTGGDVVANYSFTEGETL
jgi:LacI family transcriptional regulator